MDVGVSMNFDTSHQDEDEDEILREEEEQAKELQARLANAFDDLIDDSDTSGSSADLEVTMDDHEHEALSQSASGKTWPAPANHLLGSGHHPGTDYEAHAQYATDAVYYGNYPPSGANFDYGDTGGELPEQTGDPNAPYSPHEVGEGYDQGTYHRHGRYYDDHFGMQPRYLAGYNAGYHGDANNYYGEQQPHGPYHYDGDGYLGDGDGYHVGSQGSNHESLHSDQERGYHNHGTPEIVPNKSRDGVERESFQVKYKGPMKKDNDCDVNHDLSQSGDCSDNSVIVSTCEQRQFLEAGGSPDTRTLAQLRILYKAQARTIDELRTEIQENKDEMARESRMLNHKVTLLQGDKEGLMATLDHSQTLVKQTLAECLQLKTKLKEQENKISSLNDEKVEFQRKFDNAETTIEDLNKQLMNLGKSDTLIRQRDRQDTMLKCVQQKHQADMYHIQEKLDQAIKDLNESRDECSSVRSQLQSVLSMSDQGNLEHALTVQRLTQALDQAQKQCTDLVQSGAGVEYGRLHEQLRKTSEKQQMGDDLCQALQEELSELKEQLLMYESASHFGVFPGTNGKHSSRAESPFENQSDSFIQLNIKNNNNNEFTPCKMDKENVSCVEQESDLKRELKRCLQNYRQKQVQLSRSQGDLRTLKRECQQLRASLDTAQQTGQRYKVEVEKLRELSKQGDTARQKELEQEIAKIQKEKSDLQTEVQSLQNRINELANSEERLTDINSQLSHEMSQVLRDYDANKHEDVERYQTTYQQHYEEAKERIKQDLISNFNDERRKLIQMYEHQTETIKAENARLNKELISIKEMYVSMCHEKDDIADTVQRQCQTFSQDQMDKLRDDLRQEKENELSKLRETLQESYRRQTAATKDQWLQEVAADQKRQLDTEVGAARAAWFDEHRADKQTAVDTAVKAAHNDWRNEQERQLQIKLNEAEAAWRVTQSRDVDEQAKQLLEVECEKLSLKHRAELDAIRKRLLEEKTTAINNAKSDWLKQSSENEAAQRYKLRATLEDEFRVKYEKKLTKSLSDARELWLSEKQADLSRLLNKSRDLSHGAVRSELEVKLDQLRQDLEDCRSERHRLEAEVTSLRQAASDEQQTLVKMKDIELASIKSRKERLEQDLQACKRQANVEREALNNTHKAVQLRKESEIKALKNINNLLEAEIKGMRVDQETLEGQCESLKLRNETLEKEFVTCKGTWLAETENVIREKDSERTAALAELDDRYKRDKEALMQQHSDILGQALRSAKEEMEKEKAEMTSRYETELQRLRDRERRALESYAENPSDKSIIQEMEDKYCRERSDVDQSWSRRVTNVQQKFEREKKDLVADWQRRCNQLLDKHNDEVQSREHLEAMVADLKVAVEKEKSQDKKWEQKLSVLRDAYEREKDVLKASHREDHARTLENLKRRKETEQKLLIEKWEKTVGELRAELEHREDLLRQADKHLEMEVEKLRKALQEEHDARLDQEMHDLQERYRAEFSHATTEERLTTQCQLDEAAERVLQTERHYESVIQTYQDKVATLKSEYEEKTMELRSDLEQCRIDLDRQDADYRREIQELKSSLEAEYNAVIESCEQEKNDFAGKLELCQEQLQRVRAQKDDLENTHAQCDRKLTDINACLRRTEGEVSALTKKHEREITDMRRKLDDHHNTSLQALKSKMVELRKSHAVSMEVMKAQMLAERHDRASLQLNKQSQTELTLFDRETMDDMRTHYVNTVNKIRDDVMKHVNSTNQRAAQRVRSELQKDRQLTMKQYKQHCLNCFKQMLNNTTSSDVEAKVAALERSLTICSGTPTRVHHQDQHWPLSPQFNSQSHLEPHIYSQKLSNQSDAQTNTDLSLDEYYQRSLDHLQSQTDSRRPLDKTITNEKRGDNRSDAHSATAGAIHQPGLLLDNISSRGRDVSKSSEKYPIRNISPRRVANSNSSLGYRNQASPHDDDSQRPSREMTSGYRSASHISMETDTSSIHGNDASSGNASGVDRTKNTPRYKYTSLRQSMDEYPSSIGFSIDDVNGTTRSLDQSDQYNRSPQTTNHPTPKSDKYSTLKASSRDQISNVGKHSPANGNGVLSNGSPSNRRNQVAARGTRTDASASPDSEINLNKHVTRRTTDKPPRPIRALPSDNSSGHVERLHGDGKTNSLVKPVPLCTRQTQVPSR